MKELDKLEEDFLDFLLKSFYKNEKSYALFLIDTATVRNAVNLFNKFFLNEDKLNESNHIYIIQKIFVDNSVTIKNCGIELGICERTFYRYKKRYLNTFKNYLLQGLETEKIQASV